MRVWFFQNDSHCCVQCYEFSGYHQHGSDIAEGLTSTLMQQLY
jgi:hypothetical protein